RLKPMKKKIVGGSTCRICTSHQSKARWGNDSGTETETLGWLMPYLPKYRAESPARLCCNIHQTDVVFKHVACRAPGAEPKRLINGLSGLTRRGVLNADPSQISRRGPTMLQVRPPSSARP